VKFGTFLDLEETWRTLRSDISFFCAVKRASLLKRKCAEGHSAVFSLVLRTENRFVMFILVFKHHNNRALYHMLLLKMGKSLPETCWVDLGDQ